jgi:flap endonuclease-1
MGIQYLNSHLKQSTQKGSLVKIRLKELSGKVIVIDTSIYLYRFLGEGLLLENMYIMISLFRYYNIIPIFIFDGKPPPEKTQIIVKRMEDKAVAEKYHNDIKEILESVKNPKKYKELYENMVALKKKFIRLKRTDIVSVQKLMDAFGVTYFEAEGEADQLCAKLVIKRHAYACLSEDMDLFVYGCPRVIRYLSLMNETVIIYYLDNILSDLDLTLNEFKEICVLSGTDYNSNDKTNLFKTLEYFELFKMNNMGYNNFYEWLDNTTNYIDNIYELYNTYNMFRTDDICVKNLKINRINKEVDMNKVKEIMEPEGFIFL